MSGSYLGNVASLSLNARLISWLSPAGVQERNLRREELYSPKPTKSLLKKLSKQPLYS